jgi:hypothetical protein
MLSAANGTALARQGHAATAPDPALVALRTDAERVSTSAMRRHGAVNAFVEAGLRNTEGTQNDMLAICDMYGRAYAEFQRILVDAHQRAELTDGVQDAVIGIAIGIAVGLGAESVLAVAADASFAAEAGAEALGETIEALGGGLLHAGQGGRRAGRDAALTPGGGTRPETGRIEAFQKISRANRQIAQLSLETGVLSGIAHRADVAAGEARVQATGSSGEMTREELTAQVGRLRSAETATAGLDQRIAEGQAALTAMRAAAASALAQASQRTMEQDIWIRWIGPMGSQTANQALDLDPIEDHLHAIGVLGPNSRLGVSFGDWTSQDDTDDARRRAYWATRRMDLVGRSGLVARADQAGVWVDLQGQPRLWQVTVVGGFGGGAVRVGSVVEVTAAGGPMAHLQVRVSGMGNPGDADQHKQLELEFEGETHAAPGHI